MATTIMKFNSKIAIGATLFLLIQGCSTVQNAPAPVIAEPDYTSLDVLKDISAEARHELRILAKMKEAEVMKSLSKEQHAQRTFQALNVPRGFEVRQDFYHEGGLAVDAAEALALMAGYDFEVLNEDGAAHIPVSIVTKKKPLNEALRELGAQTGDLAEISVDEAANLITFRYLEKDSSLKPW